MGCVGPVSCMPPAHPSVIITLGPILSTDDVFLMCSFAAQGLCVGAVVGGVSVWVRVHVCV